MDKIARSTIPPVVLALLACGAIVAALSTEALGLAAGLSMVAMGAVLLRNPARQTWFLIGFAICLAAVWAGVSAYGVTSFDGVGVPAVARATEPGVVDVVRVLAPALMASLLLLRAARHHRMNAWRLRRFR